MTEIFHLNDYLYSLFRPSRLYSLPVLRTLETPHEQRDNIEGLP